MSDFLGALEGRTEARLRLSPGAWPVVLAVGALRNSWPGLGPLWLWLSEVNSFTLCRRLLKSWTPRELELGGVVSCAAICWLRALASFRSFSVRLVLRPKAMGRTEVLLAHGDAAPQIDRYMFSSHELFLNFALLSFIYRSL